MEVIMYFLEGWRPCGCVTLLAPDAERGGRGGGRQGRQHRVFPGTALTHPGLCAKHEYLKSYRGAMLWRSCLPFSSGMQEQSAQGIWVLPLP